MQKDFHVSHFNSRKGSYSILASDPFGPEGFRGLNITINLSSSKGHTKLVAKFFSESEALDPYKLSIVKKAGFIYSWFWVGLTILPRFIKQSAALFIKHKLHFWYRPEPLRGSVGRSANGIERLLEQVFREYLKHLVQQSPTPITIRYSRSGVDDASEEILMSHPTINLRDSTSEIKIKVLTPVFYSRFVHYAHDSEAIFCELTESCTFWTDKPEQLTKLFLKKGDAPLHTSNLVDYMRFQLIKNLRRRPDKIERPLTSTDKQLPSAKGVDIRGFRMSSMDAFVLGQEDIRLKKAYGMAVARLFVADHISLGSTGLLGMMELVVRVGASWLLVSFITQGIACFS
ncbi:cyclopropane-fatty-acyl-phospholipid synthase [Fusarium austroafricanum]|uniref:Cyclopropane-fatty-acyl-phospholipid synthase n=1 Tax=Fusarium austroafricanum TaxID=2364996 RepID=A0A8H4KND8_9HYPO|nr:cyclopropane-fatty-acyl-phospholipid synthase [Fusarium austroafricanum]